MTSRRSLNSSLLAFLLAIPISYGVSVAIKNSSDFFNKDFRDFSRESPLEGDYLNIKDPLRNDRRQKYEGFGYEDEIQDIFLQAERVGVEPELLMAIRQSEGSSDNFAYGIFPQGKSLQKYMSDDGFELDGSFYRYEDEKQKQLCWAAWTVKKNYERYMNDSRGFQDFISYLANFYARVGSENDPENLNKNWEPNVRYYYQKFKSE